jgi:ankyrin repeat protein
MIQEATKMKIASPNVGWELLEDVLKDLKNGNNTTISKKDKDGWTALHLAIWLGNVDIIQALLDSNADANLQSNDSLTSFHVAFITDSFDAALLLLNSNKISQANLEAAPDGLGKITALAYAQTEEAKGGANQARWQAIINALQARGINK